MAARLRDGRAGQLAARVPHARDDRQSRGETPASRRPVREAQQIADDAASRRKLQALVESWGYQAELDDANGALKSFLEQLTIDRALVKRNPKDLSRVTDLQTTLNLLGNLMKRRLKDHTAARTYLSEVVEIGRQLVDREPNNTNFLRSLAGDLRELGELLSEMGDRQAARQNFDEAFSVADQWVKLAQANLDTPVLKGTSGVVVLSGAETKTVLKRGHHRLTTYGLLKDLPQDSVKNLVYQLLDQGLLDRSDGDRPVLKLNSGSVDVLKGRQEVRFRRPVSRAVRTTAGEVEKWSGVERIMAAVWRSRVRSHIRNQTTNNLRPILKRKCRGTDA